MKDKQYYGTGRRKTSIAKVFLRKGKGDIVVNTKSLDEYFSRETSRMVVRQPLVATNNVNTFDILVKVRGGGDSSQAGAIRLGIAHAILDYDSTAAVKQADDGQELTTRKVLKSFGLLTRDARRVERKKVGRHKARKGTQYSKR